MKKKFKTLIFSLTFISPFFTSLIAQEKSEPLHFYFGLDGGYAKVSPSPDLGIRTRDGFTTSARLLFSNRWSKVSLDFGLGGLFSRMTGNDAAGNSEQLMVSVFLTDVSARYRFTPRFEFGPQAQVFMGNNAAFSKTINQFWSAFIGGEAVYRLPVGEPVRLAASFLTDINIRNQKCYLMTVGIQIGVPIFD
ncbi:MAG: hypothetical protein J0L93_04435 [Deltaproteobacteria bacterium]|nr:hypothetical protein [Deltaproteobacteria bacterium]